MNKRTLSNEPVLHENGFRAAYLIAGFLKRTLTIEEEEELDRWLQSSEYNMQLFDEITDENKMQEYLAWYGERRINEKLVETRLKLKLPEFSRFHWWRFAIGATLLFAGLSVVLYYSFFHHKRRANTSPATLAGEVVLVSGGHAPIPLPSKDTLLFPFVSVQKEGLVYSHSAGQPVQLQELRVPFQSLYKLGFSDGSKAWINSSSSLRYPSRFSGQTREVELKGEAYFEIAPDSLHPFIVSFKSLRLQVLGTAFNIRAYADQQEVSATLLEGSARVLRGNDSIVLQAGDELKADSAGKWTVEHNTDLADAKAWRRNIFHFSDAGITEVMQALEKWYGIQVEYRDSINAGFNATLSRDLPVRKLLSLLEKTGPVHFAIDGNKVIVLK